MPVCLFRSEASWIKSTSRRRKKPSVLKSYSYKQIAKMYASRAQPQQSTENDDDDLAITTEVRIPNFIDFKNYSFFCWVLNYCKSVVFRTSHQVTSMNQNTTKTKQLPSLDRRKRIYPHLHHAMTSQTSIQHHVMLCMLASSSPMTTNVMF